MARILIIDDEESIRLLLDQALTHDGHQVYTAENGKQGVRFTRQEDVDVIVTDIFMPEQEGVETIQGLRAIRPSIPIIAISGGGRFQQHDLLHLAQALGANAALKKPFSIAEIRDTVNRMLQ